MIPVYEPWLTKKEEDYVLDAVKSGWISSTGKYVDKAEELFADFLGVKHAITTTSGTTALHLCIKAALKNTPKKYIIIPDVTFIATAFAVSYENHIPLFAGVDKGTWNIDLTAVEELCKDYDIAAVIPVHLYGNPADLQGLLKLQEKYNFAIIEDACESIGAMVDGKLTGSIGEISCFSFYGNKTFLSGEGGMVVTNNDEFAARSKLLRGQAQDPTKRYWHLEVGHNYRMTNLQAAILCAQLERSNEILSEKERVARRYLDNLKDVEEVIFQKVLPGHVHSNWLMSALLPTDNKLFSDWMRDKGVDTRKIFYPLHTMPPYVDDKFYGDKSISNLLSDNGVSFPSYPTLSNSDIDFICNLIKKYFTK